MFSTLILLAGTLASAQVPAAPGKLFIINNASRATITGASNPALALSQTDRVELSALANETSSVNVQRCGASGCQDAIGQNVRLETVNKVNQAVSAQAIDSEGECRVCRNTKAIPTNLDSYVNQIKATNP